MSRMSTSGGGDSYKCLMGSTHVRVVSQFVIGYQLAFGLIVSVIALPFFLWIGALAIAIAATSILALHRRSSALLLPMVMHLYFTLLLLLFLGGFVFFANIFFNKRSHAHGFSNLDYDTETIFLLDTEKFAIILHLLNVLLLLFHMWQISVISSCRKFFDTGSEIGVRVDSPLMTHY